NDTRLETWECFSAGIARTQQIQSYKQFKKDHIAKIKRHFKIEWRFL
ncbi:uncharacterized protein METZ01_LOCUS373590, partial [marine metagenome]